MFTLTYDSMRVGDAYYRQTVTVTVDAGSLLNKATVRLDGPALDSLRVAGGIFLHDTAAVQGIVHMQPSYPLIGYAEQATAADGTPAGRNYVGVYLPGNGTEIKTEGDHLPCSPPAGRARSGPTTSAGAGANGISPPMPTGSPPCNASPKPSPAR